MFGLTFLKTNQLKHRTYSNNSKILTKGFGIAAKRPIHNNSLANLLAYTSSMAPEDKERVRVARHLIHLKNYVTAARITDPLDVTELTPHDLLFIANAKLSGHGGVEADQILKWFLRQTQVSALSEGVKATLADCIAKSGLETSMKLQRLAEIRDSMDESSDASRKVRNRVRFLEFRLVLGADGRADVFEFGEFERLDMDEPEHQLRFVPHLKALGYIDEARDLLARLLDYHGMEHYGVVVAALTFDPKWPGIDIDHLPEACLGRFDTLQLGYSNKGAGEEFDYLFNASVKANLERFNSSDIYTKDNILRNLLQVEQMAEVETLIMRVNRLPDTLLSTHCCAGIRYLMEDDFLSAKDRFMRVLAENPSDSFAAQGMRFALPRTGDDMYAMVRLRQQIGYGVNGAGRVGSRGSVGSDKTISLLMTGRYTEGLYCKRAAAHWRLLKNMYGDRFINFEPISIASAQTKSLFVIGDEGVGDETRTAQFYAFLASRFGKVTVSCDPRLEELFRRSFPSIDFVPVRRYRKGVVNDNEFRDKRIRDLNLKLSHYLTEECRQLMDSSDYITFGQTLFFNYFNGIIPRPSNGAYLRPPEVNCFDDSDVVRKLRVAILWRSHLFSTWRRFMYLRVEDFLPLVDVEGVEIWSVQHAMNQHEQTVCDNYGIRLIDDIDLFNDFDGLASYLKGMDIVIGISSLPMELAAAVGTPVWMLGFSPENYFLRTAGGKTEEDQLTLNSRVIAPKWLDFTEPSQTCIDLVIRETCDRLSEVSYERQRSTT